MIASDATNVVQVYLDRLGRSDLRSVSLSQNQFASADAPEIWVLAQDAHTYFENQDTLKRLRAGGAPIREYVVGGGVAVQVFQYPRQVNLQAAGL